MAVEPELLETVRRSVANQENNTDPEKVRGITRVEIENVEHLTHRARPTTETQFELMIDEPQERGGHDQGPAPLAYFLTGSGACLLNQFIKVNIAQGLGLRFGQVKVKGEFQRKLGGGFQSITQEVYVEGEASEEVIQRLTEKAEAFCYVHNTLRNVVKMTTLVFLNGKEVLVSTSDPQMPTGS